jgi:hypothetical protein
MEFTEDSIEFLDEQSLIDLERRLERSIEEAAALQLTEQVISGVERAQLKVLPKPYQTSTVRNLVHDFKNAVATSNFELATRIEFRLIQEIQLWRLALAKRDERIAAYDLRRFCEEATPPLSSHVFASLARFYRSLAPSSATIQSKYDLAITRLFSRPEGKNKRVLRGNRQFLLQHLTNFENGWTGVKVGKLPDDKRVNAVVSKFEEFTQDAKAYQSFEELINSDLFNRIRTFKGTLDEIFFAPAVTIAAIECNVELGNKFSELLEQENRTVADEIEVELNFGEAFHDAAPESADLARKSLEKFDGENLSEDNQNLEKVVSLLKVACGESGNKTRDNNNPINDFAAEFGYGIAEESDKTDSANFEISETSPAENESVENVLSEETETRAIFNKDLFENDIKVVLNELKKFKPNIEIISQFIETAPTPEIRELDLSAFLVNYKNSALQIAAHEETSRRKALSLILEAHLFLQTKLDGDSNHPDEESRKAIAVLLEEMQRIGSSLRSMTRDVISTDKESQRERVNHLLNASNGLLEARLQLNSAIVRQSTKELTKSKGLNAESQKIAQTTPATKVKFDSQTISLSNKTNKTAKPTKSNYQSAQSRLTVNPWLLAATIAVIVLTIGLYTLVQTNFVGGARTDNVVVVNHKDLPSGELLNGARIHEKLLVCFVTDDWANLPETEKKQKLKMLLDNGKIRGDYKRVLAMTGDGKTVGNASETEINLINQ